MEPERAAFPDRRTQGRRGVLVRRARARATALAALAAACAGGAAAQSLDDALAAAANEVATTLIREAEETGETPRATFRPAYTAVGGMNLYCDALSSRLHNLLRDKTAAEGNKRRRSFEARVAYDREHNPPEVTVAWRYDRRGNREVVKLDVHVYLPGDRSVGAGELPEVDVARLTAAQRACLYGFVRDRRDIEARYSDVYYGSAPEMDPYDIAGEYRGGDTLAVVGRLTIRGEAAPGWTFVRVRDGGRWAHVLAHIDAPDEAPTSPGVWLTEDAPAGGAVSQSQLRVVDAARIPEGGVAGWPMVAGGCWSRALPAGSLVGWRDIALCRQGRRQ